MTALQLSLFGDDEFVLPPGGLPGPAIGDGEPLPPRPFRLSMLFDFDLEAYALPYSIVGGDGRTVAGHIPSLEIARAVRDALNASHPAGESP